MTKYGEREYWYEGYSTTTEYTLDLIKISGELAARIKFSSFEEGTKETGACIETWRDSDFLNY